MSVHSTYRNGALVFWDTRQDKWLDAVGKDVWKYDNHFTDPSLASALLDGWTNTAVEAGTGSSTHIAKTADSTLGVLRWDSAANEDDGIQSQLMGTAFKLDSGNPCYFGARVALVEKTESDMFVGLAIADTSILAGLPDDIIGFTTTDADANVNYLVRESGTGAIVDTAVDFVDATFITLEFFWDGTTAYFYVDDTFIASTATNIPDDVFMRVSVAHLNGTGSSQHDGVDVDWIRCISLR